MFRTEDYVLHRMFRCSGMVIGYGRRLVNGNYLPTLKVRLANPVRQSRRSIQCDRTQKIIVEDLTSRWVHRSAI